MFSRWIADNDGVRLKMRGDVVQADVIDALLQSKRQTVANDGKIWLYIVRAGPE